MLVETADTELLLLIGTAVTNIVEVSVIVEVSEPVGATPEIQLVVPLLATKLNALAEVGLTSGAHVLIVTAGACSVIVTTELMKDVTTGANSVTVTMEVKLVGHAVELRYGNAAMAPPRKVAAATKRMMKLGAYQ